MVYAELTPSQVSAAGAVFAILAVLLTFARLVVKYVIRKRWNAEDWLIIPATILMLGMGITTCIGMLTRRTIGQS